MVGCPVKRKSKPRLSGKLRQTPGNGGSYSPLATRLAKAALRQAEEMPLAAALEHERTVMATLLSTDDHLEGIDAFLEKRRAEFAGS